VVVLSHVFYHNINIIKKFITAVKFIKVRGPFLFCVRIGGFIFWETNHREDISRWLSGENFERGR
jgi:hypothetical protein